jgi:PAS domain S-box-containing protein
MNAHSGFPDPAARADQSLPRLLLALLLACAGWAAWAQAPAAPMPIDQWRARAAEVQALSENDAPRAHADALRLQDALPADAAPADRVRALNVLARTELNAALTEPSIEHARQAHTLALRHQDKVGQAEADLNMALNTIDAALLDELPIVTTRAMAVLEGLDRPALLGEALLRVSVMYRRLGQLDESVTTAMQAMEIARRGSDPRTLAYAHQGLAIAFDQSFRHKEALEHFQQMRAQARAARSRQLEAYAMMGVGNMMNALGDASGGERAIRDGIELFRSTGAPFAIAYGMTELANHLRLQRRPTEALQALDEAVELYERHPNRIGLWFSVNARSALQLALGRRAAARSQAQRGYDLARQINFPLYLSESARRLGELAAVEGDHRRAYALMLEANEHAARATRERASTRMVQLAQRYESESRQRELDQLTQRNREQTTELEKAALRQRLLWSVLGAGLLLLALSVFFLLGFRRSQQALQRSSDALRAREQEFRALVEHSPDLIGRYDTEGRRTYVNPALAQALGAEAPALLGRKPGELAESPADQIASYEDNLREVVASGESRSMDVVRGSVHIQLRLVPEQDAQGRVASVLSIGRDVTAIVQTQRQLATLLDNMPDMVARFDAEGRNVYVNPAVSRISGWPVERFLGRRASWPGQESQLALRAALQRVADEGAPQALELPWQAPDGERWFELRLLPERDEGGRGTVLAITREITERKRVEQLVRDLGFRREAAREEERKAIARELHDELGQLLSALRFEISVLRMRFGAEQPAVAERAASMLSLVDSVIRLQRDLVSSLRPAVLDLGIGAALEWLVSEFRERNGIDCTLQLSESQVRLDADQTTVVFRIVQESLTNVARHAGAKHVQVALRRVEGDYVVSVQDDGRGFDPGGARPRKSLGLTGLQERALMLGGTLSIHSRPGAGASVVVRFPAAAPAEGRPPARVSES